MLLRRFVKKKKGSAFNNDNNKKCLKESPPCPCACKALRRLKPFCTHISTNARLENRCGFKTAAASLSAHGSAGEAEARRRPCETLCTRAAGMNYSRLHGSVAPVRCMGCRTASTEESFRSRQGSSSELVNGRHGEKRAVFGISCLLRVPAIVCVTSANKRPQTKGRGRDGVGRERERVGAGW